MSESFWLTNLTNRNVSLADLNLTIKPYASINLLNKRHYFYTKSQLEASMKSGSIYRKRNILAVRLVAPVASIIQEHKINKVDANIPSRERSVLQIKEENYEELNISDEEFAEQNADIAE